MPITVEQVLPPSGHGPVHPEPLPTLQVTVDRGPLRLRLLTLGAAIRTLEVPDASGALGHVHLHLPEVADYADHARNPHLGATVGRYANRVGSARLTLDGVEHHLDANRPPHTLHGGEWGFDRLVWSLAEATSPGGGAPDRVVMRLASPAGDMGFPGGLDAEVVHEVGDDWLALHYRAITNAPTVLSLASHGYWNLSGEPTVAGHRLAVASSRTLAIGADLVPVGALDEVAGTPLDLRAPKPLGPAIDATGGLDHCYVLDGGHLDREGDQGPVRPAALLTGGTRWMSVHTDCPGLQVYTGNSLKSPFSVHGSVSLEAQRLPDAPNHEGFGPCVLRPGDEYRSTTVLSFGVGEGPGWPP